MSNLALSPIRLSSLSRRISAFTSINKRPLRWLASLVVAGILLAVSVDAKPSMEKLEVMPAAGAVRGIVRSGAREFLGIPYAVPPTGDRRFREPEPAPRWSGVRLAEHFGADCAQTPFKSIGTRSGSEDCLFLNVYTPLAPANGALLPVMVWIHGGAMQFGSGSQYDGSRLAVRGNVVVVTLNYRLGVLGLLADSSLTVQARNGASGQYALEDQQLALRWVRINIGAFGGDPQNVTIFGESAGGDSVCWQLVSPEAKGLFAHAIIQSGACTRPLAAESLAEGEEAGAKIAKAAGCDGVADRAQCLRRASFDALLTAPTGDGTLHALWRPKYGAGLLPLSPREAFATGRFTRVPTMIGSNASEYNIFVAMEENGRAAKREPSAVTATEREKALQAQFDTQASAVGAQYPLAQYVNPGQALAATMTDGIFSCPTAELTDWLSHYTPTFAYEFSEKNALSPRGEDKSASFPDGIGAAHGAEIAFVFQEPLGPFGPLDGSLQNEQKRLSDQMQDEWTSFARTGRPITKWPSYADNRGVFVFNSPNIAVSDDFDERHHCGFWKSVNR